MSERRWDVYVRDMLDACERCLNYTSGMDQAAFLGDRRTYDATIRNVEILGEAANRVPPDVRANHPDIPWRDIIDTRNRLIHGYEAVDESVFWLIVHDDIPELMPKLRAILDATQAAR